MNVLSLFDGMSCGQIALNRIGIKPAKYYAAELDKYAITVTQANYPDTIQLGDVTKWREWDIDWASIDLVSAGFPCQSWSLAGKQLGDKDERGMLFWVTLDIISFVLQCNPKAKFMLENVKMKKEFEEYITLHTENALGVVYKTLINSSLVSAQNRQRYYWTNFPVSQPEDKGITWGDVREHGVNEFYYTEKGLQWLARHSQRKNKTLTIWGDDEVAQMVEASHYKGYSSQRFFGVCDLPSDQSVVASMRGRRINPDTLSRDDYNKSIKPEQYVEFRYDGKSNCLSTVTKDNIVVPFTLPNRIPVDMFFFRYITPLECERLQTVMQYIKQMEIVLCVDQAKSFVDAVEKNPKLLKLVSSAESEELREYARRVNQSTSANLASTKPTAQQNADMQIQTQTEKCTNINRDGLNLIASSVENTTTYRQVENVESSVTQAVFINITEGRITHHGKEELRLTEQNYTELMNGKIALNLCGGEIMENAKDALSALEMMQTNQHSTSITSFRLSTKNIEQTLIISYWFAKSAIDGFIQDTTSKKSLYLNLIDGYTAHVSNTQRYKMLGNGWTVDVIAHIFKEMNV